MQERTDRLRLGRPAPTSSARKEKQALHPPAGRGRGRVGATRLATLDAAGRSMSHTGPSQIVDPPQYQHEQHYQEQAYQQQPKFQPGYQYQEGYEYHQGYQAQFHEAYQPEQPPQQQYVEPPQQQQYEQHP